jgi:hypothetical protein
LSLKRLLELIDHEICVHLIRWENTHRTLQTALEWYLKIEEWVAIFHEKNVFWEVDFEITPHHIYLYLAEKFIWNDLKMALHIYMTLENSSWWGVTQKQVENRFLRIKSFSSFSHFGWNKKDLVYSRWLKQVIDLQKNWNYNDFEKKFYFWKMSSKDFSYFQTSTLYREFLSQKIIQPDFFWKLYFDYKILQKDIPETCSKKLILFLDEIEKILQKS